MHFRMSGSRSITKTIGSSMRASLSRHRERGRRRGAGWRDEVGHRIAAIAPAVIAAGERPDALDAALSQQQRGAGAGLLARARAVEDDVALTRDLAVPRIELVDRHVERAGDDRRLGLEDDPVAHVHDDHVLAAVELGLQLFRRDPGDVDLSQEAPAADVLPADVAADRDGSERERPAPELVEKLGHHLELRTEDPAE